jgi:AMP-polyphosphate phosphotransferase
MKHQRVSKATFERRLPQLRDELLAAQTELRQTRSCGLALIVSGTPAAGRSETINKLLEWLDPKHISVCAFDAPDHYDRLRPPMWRYWQTLPARGRMTFYFGGWYIDYLACMLHEPKKVQRHEQRIVERIRRLEQMLVNDGIRVVKLYLRTDEQTQRQRLASLRADKLTRWRVTHEDRWMARHHAQVERVARRCLKRTDDASAPWHVIDGTDEEYRLLKVAETLRDELRAGLRHTRHRSKPQVKLAVPKGRDPLDVEQPVEPLAQGTYDKELEKLQSCLATLVRRSRFRKHALVLAFEGMDAAGKGGAIRRVTHALDARQYQVVPISAPTPEELLYPYLWRFWRHVPERGAITIYDRSWYGRVLVERVRDLTPAPDWQRAYGEINEFELELSEHGIIVQKFWLQVSKGAQLERFKVRDSNPLKRFKVDKEDWVNRRYYDDYQVAAAQMIHLTHTASAPWTVIAADDKQRARLEVLKTLCERLQHELDQH